MTNRDRAVLALQCAASAPVHVGVDILKDFALTEAQLFHVQDYCVRAIGHVCRYGAAPLTKDPVDWWRETLADAEAALRCGEVD